MIPTSKNSMINSVNMKYIRKEKICTHIVQIFCLVLETGIEPVRYRYRRILSPVRLPIPPLQHIVEAPPRFELGNEGFADLCLTAWLWCHTIYLIIFNRARI